MAVRPKPKNTNDDGLVFMTRFGHRWVRVTESKNQPGRAVIHDVLTQRFGKVLRKLGINGRKRLGFYAIRHVFQTSANLLT